MNNICIYGRLVSHILCLFSVLLHICFGPRFNLSPPSSLIVSILFFNIRRIWISLSRSNCLFRPVVRARRVVYRSAGPVIAICSLILCNIVFVRLLCCDFNFREIPLGVTAGCQCLFFHSWPLVEVR